MREITIRFDYLPLPAGINGVMGQADTGEYLIGLNETASQEQQAATFLHECLHIFHNDTESNRPAEEIEADRHQELKTILQNLLE